MAGGHLRGIIVKSDGRILDARMSTLAGADRREKTLRHIVDQEVEKANMLLRKNGGLAEARDALSGLCLFMADDAEHGYFASYENGVYRTDYWTGDAVDPEYIAIIMGRENAANYVGCSTRLLRNRSQKYGIEIISAIRPQYGPIDAFSTVKLNLLRPEFRVEDR